MPTFKFLYDTWMNRNFDIIEFPGAPSVTTSLCWRKVGNITSIYGRMVPFS